MKCSVKKVILQADCKDSHCTAAVDGAATFPVSLWEEEFAPEHLHISSYLVTEDLSSDPAPNTFWSPFPPEVGGCPLFAFPVS